MWIVDHLEEPRLTQQKRKKKTDGKKDIGGSEIEGSRLEESTNSSEVDLSVERDEN